MNSSKHWWIIICAIVLALALLFTLSSDAQTTVPSVAMPAQTLSGNAVPATLYTCDAGLSNVLFIQLNAMPGQRVWFCDNATGTYAWDHLIGAGATGTTVAINATQLALAGCLSATVTISGATPGVNVALAAPLGQTTSVTTTAGLTNATAWVSATNTVTLSVCALAPLTTAAISYRILLF